jgi:hypothetical protein
MTDYAVKVLKQTDDAILIGGYGVIFGGEDLMGDTFTAKTDFMLDMVPVKQIMYQHGMLEDVDHFIGKSTNEILRKAGLWVEAQLEKHQDYVDEILELIEKKALGWSSQAAGSLVKYADDWKTIVRWPIIEHSLTPTPAEPRTIGVERIKALAIDNPRLKALLPTNKYIQLRARAHLALD